MNYRRLVSATLLAASLILFALIPAELVSSPSAAARTAPLQADVGVEAAPQAQQALVTLQNASTAQLVTQVARETGAFSFVRADGGGVLAADNPLATPEQRARVFLGENGGLVGMNATERDFAANPGNVTVSAAASALKLDGVSTDALGQTHVKFDQTYRGLPVFGAQLIVHMNDHGITGVNGRFVPGIDADVFPAVNAQAAAKTALDAVAKSTPNAQLSVASTGLAIFRTGMFEGYQGTSVLAHDVKIADASGPLEQVWISASSGAELMRIPLRHEALYRRVYSPRYDSSNPDMHVVRDENDLLPNPVPPIEGLFQFSGHTYRLFASAFGRDSFSAPDWNE